MKVVLTARFSHPFDPWKQTEDPLPDEAPDQPVVRKQHQRRLDEPEILKLITGYISGQTVTQLVNTWGIHRTTVLDHLERAGVARRANKRKLTDRQVKNAGKLYESGQSVAKVAKRYGVHEATMARELRSAGITIRPRNGWAR